MGSDRRVLGRALVAIGALVTAFLAASPVARAAPLAASVTGGDRIHGSAYQCTAGVNVTDGSVYYIVTLGLCGEVESVWYTSDDAFIGYTAGSTFPPYDGAIIRYDGDVAHPGTIGAQDVTSAGDARIGENVCARTAAAGVACGQVQFGVDAASDGTFADICGGSAYVGAPVYDGTTVLGLVTDVAKAGCGVYFEPVTGLLAQWGVSVY